MKFESTLVHGAFQVVVEPRHDDRGFFGRIWCEREFADAGIDITWRQANVGFSHAALTLRGIHLQRAPDAEAKLVRCTRGRVFDVAVDLRPSSPTYRRWTAEELTAENGRMLFVPEGCGHAYLTLEDDSEIIYLTSAFYAAGVRDRGPVGRSRIRHQLASRADGDVRAGRDLADVEFRR